MCSGVAMTVPHRIVRQSEQVDGARDCQSYEEMPCASRGGTYRTREAGSVKMKTIAIGDHVERFRGVHQTCDALSDELAGLLCRRGELGHLVFGPRDRHHPLQRQHMGAP